MTINEILEEEKKKLDSWKIFCNVEERMHGRISKSTLRDKEILEFKVSILEELIQYQSIGTVEECRAAAEKQRAIKPTFVLNFGDFESLFACECGKKITVRHDRGVMVDHNGPNFCSNCGRKWDWSDTP